MQDPKISCLIVDDEPMALRLIESYVLKTPYLDLRGQCSSAFEVLEVLNNESIDLLFLDIQMPELNGIELSRTLKKETRVIFTTAYDNYAIEGFRVEALDYLLKPFNYQEFLTAANKAKEWFSMLRNSSLTRVKTSNESYIFVKSEYKQLKIHLDDVLYFEGLKDYIKIWLKSQARPVLTLMSLKSLEEDLPTDKFMRVHRSFIVALSSIEAIERNQIIICDQRITVADQYKQRFQDFVNGKSVG